MTTLIVAILTWVHILAVAGWIGGTVYEIIVYFPLMEALPVEAKKAAFLTSFRIFPLYYLTFGTLTIASGALLFIIMGGSLDLSSLWNLLVIAGGLVGLGVWTLARIIDRVMAPKIIRGVEHGSFPQMKQLMLGGVLVLVLLLIAFTLMVTAALL